MDEQETWIEPDPEPATSFAAALPPAAPPALGPPRWSPLRRFLFWFACVYFVLYALPFPADVLPRWGAWSQRFGGIELPAREVERALDGWDDGLQQVQRWTGEGWVATTAWVAEHFLDGREVPQQPTGSGDTLHQYLKVLVIAVAALVLGLALAFVLRRAPRPTVRWALVVGVRYYLAFLLLSYGFFKVVKSQFPYPKLTRLVQPYGESSPMGLVWTFMGTSAPYNWFTGGGEVLAGALLLFRRTRTLGALLGFAVLANVAMLNFAYDVPVKLFSLHLCAFAVALAALDGRRLWRVFVTNRATHPVDLRAPVRNALLSGLGWLLKIVIVAQAVWGDLDVTNQVYAQRDGAPRPELYGIWEVDAFEQSGSAVPPLDTSTTRWRRMVHDLAPPGGPTWITVQTMDGTSTVYRGGLEPQEDGRRLLVLRTAAPATAPAADGEPSEAPAVGTFEVERPTDGELVLSGELGGAPTTVRMTRRLPEDFLLLNRGFHWIQELPFNR